MSEEDVERFLAQFKLAKEEVKSWPEWMQKKAHAESAHLREQQKERYL